MKKKLISLQACRALAVLLVWIAHCRDVERTSLHSSWLESATWGRFGVDLFFVISGIVIATVTDGKHQKPPEAWRFLYHRFARIYPTFWVYFSVAVAIYFSSPSMIRGYGTRPDFLASALLLPTMKLN